MKTIYTIGHSTRTFEQFAEILRAHDVKAVADVRLIPGSRRYPHFGDEYLAKHLPENGIEYLSFKSLGGRRKAKKDSINVGWRNESFRGYADFMQTAAFDRALDELVEAARERATAIMCAEAVPWRCHRSLISDALVVRGWKVLDIMDAKHANEHKLTKFAQVHGKNVSYPAEENQLFPSG